MYVLRKRQRPTPVHHINYGWRNLILPLWTPVSARLLLTSLEQRIKNLLMLKPKHVYLWGTLLGLLPQRCSQSLDTQLDGTLIIKANISFTEALRHQTLFGIFALGELDESNETQEDETFVHKLEGQKKNFNNSREAQLKIYILLKRHTVSC